ncbi:Peptidase M16 inactive domain protein [Aphelenchoides besseyi]|nr:Peptidase M16 inactive domain protein [Aphelenchoides besseyi]
MLLNNYKLVLQSKYANKIPINVYRSERTGLHVAVAKAPGPAVSCNIVVPTEVETNDGLPHTLEHLVFMGSKSIPYKGTLDLLSLKAMSLGGGTNAVTEKDHTCYFVKTLGEAGMRDFVRIYADHLINPLLTPENYASEVYHVNDEGEETGVVYSEIQGYEHDLDRIVEQKVFERAFPTVPSFYAEQGGLMREVREMCTLKRVQDYHSHFYQLRNMWILLCGTFDVEEMLKSIDQLDSLAENAPPEKFDRPFINVQVPDIQRTRKDVDVVYGPSENEDEAMVQIGFLGRSANDIEFLYAVEIIGSYLSKTSSAPLQREMVMIEEPFCDSVEIETTELPRCLISFHFTGVPLEQVDEVADKFFEVLEKAKNSLDLDRIHYIANRNVKKIYSGLDTDVSEVIFYGLIGHQLFADPLEDQEQFEKTMNPLSIYETLLQKPVDYWRDLISELFTENCTVVIGRPDPELAEKIASEEVKRLEELKRNVEAGQIKRIRLDEDTQEDKATLSVISQFNDIGPEQKIDSFRFTTSVLNPNVKGDSELLSSLPFTTVLHDVDSHFVRTYFIFDMKDIPVGLRKYSMILTELIFKSPAVVNGKKLTDEQVADLMTKRTHGPSSRIGYLHLMVFYLEVTAKEFDLISKWSRALLKDTEFESGKVLSIAKNLKAGASAKTREADAMCTILMTQLNNQRDHESSFYDDYVLQNFHRDVAKQIESGGSKAQKVMDELNKLREAILCAPLNVHLICNPRELKSTTETKDDWTFLNQTKADKKITMTRDVDVTPFKCWKPAARVIKVDGSDASHIFCRSKVQVEFGSEEHVAVLTLASYISMIEGELWTKHLICLFSSVSDSLILELDRCSRPVLAFEASRDVVCSLFNSTQIDPIKFDLAKRNSICSLMLRYETLKSTANYAAYDALRGMSSVDIERLTQQIWNAEADEMVKLARPHFLRLFDETEQLIAVACPRSKLEEIKKRFPNIQTFMKSVVRSIMQNYKTVLKSNYMGKYPVTVFESKRSGLHVALVQVPGPTVSCQINLATPTKTEDGLPHTLEHLVFMGSKLFPFKGALDLLSLEAMSVGGTNAFTSQEYTAYTVKTIGSTGMQQFLPIYGDHLLNPILNHRNYQTEVYHINEKGQEAGVVYSEMQEIEKNLNNMVHFKRLQNVYPTCPELHVQTGGRLKEIRDLCSAERVQDYHRRFYHLRNMWVMLVGSMKPEELLKYVDQMDQSNESPDQFEKPFVNMNVPDIQSDWKTPLVVRAPDPNQSSTGTVQIGFLSRSSKDYEFEVAVCDILDAYLTTSTSAPLQREMVLIQRPFCNSVVLVMNVNTRCEVYAHFTDVPLDRMDEVTPKFFEIMKQSASNIDLERIRHIIRRQINKINAQLEGDFSAGAFCALTNLQLFEDDYSNQEYIDRIMNPILIYEDLLTRPAEYWADLIHEIFTSNCVVVHGKPDAELAELSEKEEKERLKKLSEDQQALACHRLAPEDPSDSTSRPSFDVFHGTNELPAIDTFRIQTSVLDPNSNELKFDKFPFTSIVHSLDSNFIRAVFLFDLKSVPLELRKYTMLFSGLLFSSAAKVDGQLLSAEQVADLLTKEIMSNSCNTGLSGNFKHFLHLYLELPSNEYENLPKWTKALLHDTQFDSSKILSIVKNLANTSSSTKRDGYTMCTALLTSMNLIKGHEKRFYDPVVLENFHRELATKLDNDNSDEAAKEVIDKLNQLRAAILSSPMNLQLLCDPERVKASKPLANDAWSFLESTKASTKITASYEKDVEPFRIWEPSSRFLTLDTSDASYVAIKQRAVIESGSPEHVALLIFCNYFSMTEGLLWNEIRGCGLAYAAQISYSKISNTIALLLYRCSRPDIAYTTCKKTMTNFLENPVDKVLFDLAKKGVVSALMNRYETLSTTAWATVSDNLRGLSMENTRKLTENVWNAKVDKSFELAAPFLARLFDEQETLRAIVCPSAKLDDVKKTFSGIEKTEISELQYTPE